MNKRLLSLLLACLMLVSLLPTAAFAAAGDGEPLPAEPPAAAEDAAQAPAGDTPAPETAPASLSEFSPDASTYDYTGTVTATAPSYQSATGQDSPAAALDNDSSTWYHSAWGTSGTGSTDLTQKPEERYIQLTLETPAQLNGLRYQSRSMDYGDYGNGVVTQYEIWASSQDTVTAASKDGFTKVAEGTWEVGASAWRYALFDHPVTAKHVRLYGVATYGNGHGLSGDQQTDKDVNKFISAAELRLMTPVNLARLEGVTATADDWEEGTRGTTPYNLNGAQTIDGIKSGDEHANSGHWSTNAASGNPDRTLTVDLHRLCDVSSVKLFWKHDSVTAYTLQASQNGTNWTTIGSKSTRVSASEEGETLSPSSTLTNVRYIKLSVTGYDNQGTANWANVNLWEIEIYGIPGDLITVNTPDGNLCRPATCDPADTVTTVTASVNNVEADTTFTADKIIDGNQITRWSTDRNSENPWAKIDLGTERSISRIISYWCGDDPTTAVNGYTISVSNTSADGPWTVVKTVSGAVPCLKNVTASSPAPAVVDDFDPVDARYIMIQATGYREAGWKSMALWEVEVYRDAAAVPAPVFTATTVASWLTPSYNESTKKFTYTVSNDADQTALANYDITVSANLEQVVGPDGTVYQPLSDIPVEVAITATNKTNPADRATTSNSTVLTKTITGQADNTGTNPKPAVIPEIMEWHTTAAQNDKKFTLTKDSRIIHRFGAAGGFDTVANELTADIKDLFGFELEHVHVSTYAQVLENLRAGDIVIYNVLDNGIVANRDLIKGFDNETYRMDITDKVILANGNPSDDAISHITIYAKGTPDAEGKTGSVGAYWATRTLLQALKLSQAAGDGLTIAYGSMRDYPEFKVRGFVFDVGRKPQSMDALKKIVKNMAWYKLNDFHIHLNDNLIFLENYIPGWTSGAATTWEDYIKANDAYSAFRLESSVQEEEGGIPLSAKDYHYTKAEFKQFIADSAALGINVVPEIDAPAHAKSITDAFPSLRLYNADGMTNHPYNDHLDLGAEKYEQSLEVVQNIFDEYLGTGVNDVFTGGTVHLGADEYYDNHAAYRRFVIDMIAYLKEQGKTPRVWGSLTSMSGQTTNGQSYDIADHSDVTYGVQMNIWSTGWANPANMYDMGFDLINVTDGPFYMVPNGGGGRGNYGDYLNLTAVYDKAPNNIGGTTFPAGSPQILGSSYAIWMDNIDTKASGLDEYDTFHRFFDTLPVAAVRQWGEGAALDRTLAKLQEDAAITGYAPNSNPYDEGELAQGSARYLQYNFSDQNDTSGNGHTLTLHNASLRPDHNLLILAGGSSYAETGMDRLGWGNRLSFRALKLTGGGSEEVLFETDAAYGDYAIKALPVEGDDTKWRLGFSRELYDYEFPVDLPVGEWVELSITNERQSAKLSVDGDATVNAVGKFVAKADSNTQFTGKTGISNSSFQLPLARIGGKANAFHGYVASVSVSPTSSTPVDEGDYVVKPTENHYTLTAPSELKTVTSGEGPATLAGDGDLSTFWHSNWSTATADNPADLSELPEKRYIQIELARPADLASLLYHPRSNAGNGTVTQYEVWVSTETSVTAGSKEGFTKAAEGTWARSTGWKTAKFTGVQAGVKFIRLYGVATHGDVANKFMTAAEVRVCNLYDLNGTNANGTPKGLVELSGSSFPLVDGKAEPLPTVTFEGTVLVKDEDYTLTYTDNTQVSSAASSATVTVTGKGAYTGTLSTQFKVTAPQGKVSLAAAEVTLAAESYPLVNDKAEPDPVVTLGETTLLRGLDYTVTYANNTRVGTATLTITGIDRYEGSKTLSFTVDPPLVKKDLSRGEITLHQRAFPYEGVAITPDPVVTFEGTALIKGEDYTVSYARNNNIGTATVTVTGINIYEGTLSANFTIVDPALGNDLSNVEKTAVIFRPTEYPYTGNPITPTFVVTYNGRRLVRDTDYTVELSNNVQGGTGVVVIRGMGDYYGPFVATFTITGGGSGNPGGSGGGGGSSGGGSGVVSGGTYTTSTEKRPDGVSVTTKTYSDGAMASTATYPDGSKVVADIPVTGPITAVVTVPFKADKVSVTIPTRGAATAGQVAVILHPDGSEEIVKTSTPTENGVSLTLDASATIQVVDNAKTFVDVPANSWAKDAIAFVTSREIFNGTGNATFSPNSEMSRAMVCTVLANLAGEDTKAGATWYEKGLAWAKEKGISDTTAPHSIITREQLAVMLYRNAGSPVITDEVPRRFRDRENVSDWAELAVTWAVQNDLLRGRSSLDGLDLAPQATATRAEVASVLQRYVALLK